jgi:uncharacterized repeat protein (TIGR03803 family)
MSKFKSSWWKTACAVVVLCAATAIGSPAQTFTTLANFDATTGSQPIGSLVQGPDGNFYGTANANGAENYGTVFKLTPSGTLTVLYSFCTPPLCLDGADPSGGLVLGRDGNFYGTTYLGGGTNSYGTVFRITPAGMLTTLHAFHGADGATPSCMLVEGTDGDFYGTTSVGGANSSCFNGRGCGTVFKITPGGTLTTLHSFDFTDGADPFSGLIQAIDGNFYGTTPGGGTTEACGTLGCGTVFRITPGGILTTLHTFHYMDGANPEAALVQAADGDFYGTTSGAQVSLPGTVFEITSKGVFTTLHTFDVTDGANPFNALIQGTDGNLYGTTSDGGANDCGTVFRITPGRALATLHSFDYTDGCGILAPVLQATNGTFYGTTIDSGQNGDGTAFSLAVGLRRFVTTVPATGGPGRMVLILGNNLTGTTSVTFNGTPATFTVVSSTLITTMVPAGATTGPVQVTTPSGTLTSNVPFRVRQ